MRSGRSSSEARGGALRAVLCAIVLLGAAGSQARAVQPAPIPPPPPNPGEGPPAAKTPPAARTTAPRRVVCPRCGYYCEPSWHYCLACGWDLTALVGADEEARLQAIARATVRVVAGGRPNRYSTAFPFGNPGLFLTNARTLVASDATLLRVVTFDNHEYPATVVGIDLPTGLGVLKAQVPNMPAVEPSPAPPAPPENDWAVCYPIAREDDVVRYLPVALHRGHVTAAGQTGTSLVSFENLVRTDHAIEEGCTGGPLVDSRGRIAGMILGGPDDGITYATPLDGAPAVIKALLGGQAPVRPYFGVGLVTPDERRRARFGLAAEVTGPMVGYVIPGSPAARAGLRPGDVLAAVAAAKTATVREAGARLLAAVPGGPEVSLTIVRGGSEQSIGVQPVQRPERVLLDPSDEIQEALEVNLKEVTSGPGAQQGLVVADLVRGGRGEKVHYHNGDIIVAVGKKSVKTLEGFNEAIRTQVKKVFAEGPAADTRWASSYVVDLEVRAEGGEKETRPYVNLFPDFLAPPVF